MLRQIIHIDRSKCTGCGLCASACHEGAIGMVGGKAWLLREDFCDGFGDCLPACPADAIRFEQREAPAYNESAVLKAKELKAKMASGEFVTSCHGSAQQELSPKDIPGDAAEVPCQLRNFPVQIKLVSESASVLDGCDLLIAADCTGFACPELHSRFLKGRVCLIGCPKLDAVDYAEKLGRMFAAHEIRSVTVLRMQVPCCGGLTKAVERALAACGKRIPCSVYIVSPDGSVREA